MGDEGGTLTKRKIALIVIALLVVIQIPAWFFQTNPPVLAEPNWDSPATRALTVRACFDCHSNETIWPIYSRVAPISWLVTLDTVRGRSHLNFSEWGVSRRGQGNVSRQIQSGEMPPAIYLTMHPDAKLADAEKTATDSGIAKFVEVNAQSALHKMCLLLAASLAAKSIRPSLQRLRQLVQRFTEQQRIVLWFQRHASICR